MYHVMPDCGYYRVRSYIDVECKIVTFWFVPLRYCMIYSSMFGDICKYIVYKLLSESVIVFFFECG